MKIGVVQMPVSPDKDENLLRARYEILSASQNGAEIVVLPEMFCCPYNNQAFKDYAEPCYGKVWTQMRNAAKESGVYLVAGSFPELCEGKLFNTCCVFSPDCDEHIAVYRKMHLFDIDVRGGQRFFESDTLTAGDNLAVFDTPYGRCGVCICFDIRFPELARLYALNGVSTLFVPAAFNMTTGPAHWELTMRARALDNQIYVVACAPARDENAGYVSYANSIVCNPWGSVDYCARTLPETFVADISPDKVSDIRAQLPLLSARRCDLYNLEFKK